MTNTFKPIRGFENYWINQDGIVFRPQRTFTNRKGRVVTLKAQFIKIRQDKQSGYLVVKLTRQNGKYGSQYLHRLVALTFIENPENKLFVNHLDGNKRNPQLSNLQWATRSENQRHACENGFAGKPNHNQVPVYDLCTNKHYNSIKEASAETGIPYNTLKQKLLVQGAFGCLKRAA